MGFIQRTPYSGRKDRRLQGLPRSASGEINQIVCAMREAAGQDRAAEAWPPRAHRSSEERSHVVSLGMEGRPFQTNLPFHLQRNGWQGTSAHDPSAVSHPFVPVLVALAHRPHIQRSILAMYVDHRRASSSYPMSRLRPPTCCTRRQSVCVRPYLRREPEMSSPSRPQVAWVGHVPLQAERTMSA